MHMVPVSAPGRYFIYFVLFHLQQSRHIGAIFIPSSIRSLEKLSDVSTVTQLGRGRLSI